MMKTGKNKRLLASILAASMLLAMSPFALAEGTEDTTGQEQSTSQSAEVKTEGEGTGIAEPEKTEAPKNAARIGKTEYASIADALAVAQPGDTIKLLKDIAESVEVKVAKNFDGELTIDLNTYSINGDTAGRCIWRTGSTNCWPQKLIVKNGTLKNGSGGAIQWKGDLEVTDCRFEKNQGGAVYVDHGTLDITDCTFEKNSAGFGGAIAVSYIEELTIGNDTNFLDNNASYGGGLYANGAKNINIAANSVLCNNTASGYGGGIYASASNINIAANSAVYNNTATTAGDDLFFFSNSTFTLPNAKKMSGDRILPFDNMEITGWYHDGYKWNTAANDGQGGSEKIRRWVDGYIDEYIPAEKDTQYISLKAAHPLIYTLTYDVTGDRPEGYTAPAKQTLVNGSSYTVPAVPASVSGSKDGVNGTFSFDG